MEMIRNLIRNTISEYYDKDRQKEINDWSRFSEFGGQLLSMLRYKGNYAAILNRVKKGLEEDGWVFEEPFEPWLK